MRRPGKLDNSTVISPGEEFNLGSSNVPWKVSVFHEGDVIPAASDDEEDYTIVSPTVGLVFPGCGSPEIVPEALSLFWFGTSKWELKIDAVGLDGDVSIDQEIERGVTVIFNDGVETYSGGAAVTTFSESFPVVSGFELDPDGDFPELIDPDFSYERLPLTSFSALFPAQVFVEFSLAGNAEYYVQADEWVLSGGSLRVTYYEAADPSDPNSTSRQEHIRAYPQAPVPDDDTIHVWEIRPGAEFRYYADSSDGASVSNLSIEGTIMESDHLTLVPET